MEQELHFDSIISFIRGMYPEKSYVGLHEPVFCGNERKYVLDAIDSTYVSSVGSYVNLFEEMMAKITGTRYAVAIVNGTNALHIALMLAGVTRGEEVITQALTFIATANAISYNGAYPVFVDVDNDTLGMSPEALSSFLANNVVKKSDGAYNKITGRRIAACVPMHTFGLPCRIDEIRQICDNWNIPLVEDAAESLGSYYDGKHTGSFGLVGVFSFNGNKTVTSGGGGAIVTDDECIARRAKHLTTQAKVPHRWDFVHDEIGYNFRMPNLNAAFACAQLEQLDKFISDKRLLAKAYEDFFGRIGVPFMKEIPEATANYWLNAILFQDRTHRDSFLAFSNNNGVMTRPVWELMTRLKMFRDCQSDGLSNSIWIADRLVNIPSGFRSR
ncbi:LegC family aminotransferase [Pedobacter sp. JY14-1]|uniref:LegC family aminotransferase n=1 Tax=Pedobacter sp. JY14-1 TaxID=3034151 RepID=UPI0023E305E7|nr:LegC family aminotransferase [Pedobacter sp. JY14-1]